MKRNKKREKQISLNPLLFFVKLIKMAQQYQTFIPIQGVTYGILPEVSLRGKNSFETDLYAQDNDLTFLPSPDVNKIAKAVQPEKPSRQFISYARKQAKQARLTDEDIREAYEQLHEQIWKKYWIRAKEILVWLPRPMTHPRILNESPTSEVISILIKDYKATKEEKFDIRGIEPDPSIQVKWPRKDGNITPELAQLLGAQNNIYVWTNSNPQHHEGLRALYWDFGDRERPSLDSDWDPWLRDSDVGSLLGRKMEKNLTKMRI
jgi:hypothetical protein